MRLEIWIDGAPGSDHASGYIGNDNSVVCFDNDDTGGVDVFYSKYGQLDIANGLFKSLPAPPPPTGQEKLSCVKSAAALSRSMTVNIGIMSVADS